MILSKQARIIPFRVGTQRKQLKVVLIYKMTEMAQTFSCRIPRRIYIYIYIPCTYFSGCPRNPMCFHYLTTWIYSWFPVWYTADTHMIYISGELSWYPCSGLRLRYQILEYQLYNIKFLMPVFYSVINI